VAHRAKLVARGVAVGLVVLLFILLAWTLLTEEGGDLAAAAARGDRPQAPDFTLERLDEEGELRLSSLRGKAVVLNFWASWCVPCREEAPRLQAAWEMGARVFLELGPGSALTRITQEELPEACARSIEDFNSLQGIGRWVSGALAG